MIVIYKNHEITFNKKPIPQRGYDFDYVPEDYDGRNGDCGACGSVSECMSEIDERTK